MTFQEFMKRAKRAEKKNMIYAGLCAVGCIAALVFAFFF
jgi:hypothetical protein